MRDRFILFPLFCFVFLVNCSKDPDDNDRTMSNYTGSYKNIEFTESLIQEFTPGIYKEADIPDDVKLLTHGRIEIDFQYNGGALHSFMPLMYYGSANKNNHDDAVEEPAFHLVVENWSL